MDALGKFGVIKCKWPYMHAQGSKGEEKRRKTRFVYLQAGFSAAPGATAAPNNLSDYVAQ